MSQQHEKTKVVFIWPATDELKEYFHKELDHIADIQFTESREEESTALAVRDAEIIVGWAVRESVLAAAPRLKLVIIPAIGVERHIPILRKFPHVQAVNSRGNAVPSAQHAMALLLAATNYVVYYDSHMRDGNWRAYNDNPASVLLEDMTVGILGTGTIGKELMKRLPGFGCHIIGCSRSGSQLDDYPDIPIYSVDALDTFLGSSQILIVAVPNTEETNGMIGADQLKCLPDNAIVINIARGPVVQEEALYNALKNGKLLSAGIDVWYNYRPEAVDGRKYPYTFPFHTLDNIVLSPHRGGSPLKRPGRYVDVVDNIKRFINSEPLTNRLDFQKGY